MLRKLTIDLVLLKKHSLAKDRPVGGLFVPFRRDENAVRIHGAAVSPALHHCPANQKQRRNAPGTPKTALRAVFLSCRMS